MTRRRLLLLFLPALLIAVLAWALAWLLRSESGADWLWQRVTAAAPGALRAESVSGDLRSGLQFAGISYRSEGFALEVDRVALRLDFDVLPPAVSVRQLRFGRLDMRSWPTSDDVDPTPPDEWLPSLSLPVPVTLRRVQGDRVTWTRAATGAANAPAAGADAGSAAYLLIRDLTFAADWYRRLALRELHFAGPDARWQGRLALALQPPYRLDLAVQGDTPVPGLTATGATSAVNIRATGSLEVSQWQAELAVPAVRLGGELRDLLGEPAWDLQLTAERLAWPAGEAEPGLVLHGLSAGSYGTLADYGVEAEARVDGDGIPETQVRAVGSGDRSAVAVEVLHLAGEALVADGDGRLEWSPAFAVQAALDVARIDPQPWFEAWGEAAPASGRLQVRWQDDRLTFAVAEAAAPGSVAALTAAGELDTDGGAVTAKLDWQGLAWPPGAATPTVLSERGRAEVSGRLDDWRVTGELELSGPDFPAGRLQVAGGGNRDSLSLRVPEGAALGGSLAGRFDVSWAPDVRWSADATLANVATAPLAPAFPGRLSGGLSASGRPAADPQGAADLQIDIRNLNGVIRDRPFAAAGRLVMEAGRLHARGLRLRSGQSEITADGHLQGAAGLSFRADIASLGDLVDGGTGRFAGEGMISLAAGNPKLRLDGSGRDLAWESLSAGEVDVETTAAGAIRLEAQSLTVGETPIASLALTVSGQRPLERLEAGLVFDETEARLGLEGGVVDWQAPLAKGWQGRLIEGRVDSPGLGFIELQQPTALRLGPGGLALDEACFEGSREGRLCMESQWRTGGDRVLDVVLVDVSPNLAMRLLGSDLQFSQRLSGEIHWRQRPPAEPEAQVRLDISPGHITVLGEDEPVLATGAGLFGFGIGEGRLHSGDLDIPLTGGGGVDIDFGVPNLDAGAGATLEGRLRVDLDDIEPLLSLLPGVEGSSGPVTADLEVGGTVTDPELTGHVSLVRGRLSHFASGLLLQDIRLGGAVNAYDQTEINGSFRSGEGQGSVRAVVNFGDPLKPELLVELEGENLTLIDVPDLRVTANPDLRVTWREGAVGIDGRVLIPSARLSPRFLPTATAAESEDVVIVAGDRHLLQQPVAAPVEHRIRGQLELELGNDVQLQLDRATALLSGTTQFTWDGQLVPVANGSFAVRGEIKAYGQLLEVTDGRVNFSGRPADNPFLNVRAEREIYGNTQVTKAGVHVTGTVKQPDLEVYTVPMTTRERALTLLVTGSDFNYEQGVGSVEVGMYVAPKLYISYGIGLFDEQNVISARYDLGKGFGIKTTSGQRETGADISYTIER